jgi:hypothetical protein
MSYNLRSARSNMPASRRYAAAISTEDREIVADLRRSGMSVADYAREHCHDADRLLSLERAVFFEEERARKKIRSEEKAIADKSSSDATE